jgi:ABC-type phosphate/phosphonate transport system ATPase subunit
LAIITFLDYLPCNSTISKELCDEAADLLSQIHLTLLAQKRDKKLAGLKQATVGIFFILFSKSEILLTNIE